MDEAGPNLIPITNPRLGHRPDDASGCTVVPIGAPGGAVGAGPGGVPGLPLRPPMPLPTLEPVLVSSRAP